MLEQQPWINISFLALLKRFLWWWCSINVQSCAKGRRRALPWHSRLVLDHASTDILDLNPTSEEAQGCILEKSPFPRERAAIFWSQYILVRKVTQLSLQLKYLFLLLVEIVYYILKGLHIILLKERAHFSPLKEEFGCPSIKRSSKIFLSSWDLYPNPWKCLWCFKTFFPEFSQVKWQIPSLFTGPLWILQLLVWLVLF